MLLLRFLLGLKYIEVLVKIRETLWFELKCLTESVIVTRNVGDNATCLFEQSWNEKQEQH